MFYWGNVHEQVAIIDFVKDAITTLAHSIAATMKLLDSRRSRVFSKLVDSSAQLVPKVLGN